MHGQNKLLIKRKVRKFNKKGVVFAASTALFMTVLLLFAVTVYQTQEDADNKVITSSLATRVIELADSIETSVKKIYLVNNNISLNISTEIINGYTYYIDIVMINTTLLEEGPTSAKFNSDLAELESLISTMGYGAYFNSSAIINDSVLKKGEGIGIYKTASNTLTGEGQRLIIYYNKSGNNAAKIPSIYVEINSFENMSGIYESASFPVIASPSHFLNITINDMNFPTDLLNSEEPEDSKEIFFDTLGSSDSYTWLVNNTGNTTSFLNITLDNEKVEITTLEGDYNITVYIYMESAMSSYDFYFEPYAVKIYIPKYEAKKTSQIRFI